MRIINFAIKTENNEEPKSFNILLSELPNDYGLFNCKILDETLSEIFSVSKSNFTECEHDLVSIISNLGDIINIHEVKPDNETKRIIDILKNMKN